MNDNMQKKQNINSHLVILVLFVGMIAGIIGGAIVYIFVIKSDELTNIQEPAVIVDKVTQLQDESIVNVVEKTTPSVVSIIVKKDIKQYQQLSPFDLFYGQSQQSTQGAPPQKQKIGGGTGFFMTTDGMIVTNKHVVSDLDAEYSVVTSSGEEYQAKILAVDDILDFAVLKVEPKNGEQFSAATLGDSDKIKIGQTVIAIGNSLGEFSHSVSRGIISGMQRDIVAGGGLNGVSEKLTNIIQTDAAINFGNSGGPLINLEGKVIGINTAVAQGAENIGFAIPINQVARLIEDVKEKGFISRPFLGIRYIVITPQIAQQLKLPYDSGVIVTRGRNSTDMAVLPDSPADKAGIVENDIILKINGKEITSENSLLQEISKYKVGDKIVLTIWRTNEEKEMIIILEDKNMLNMK